MEEKNRIKPARNASLDLLRIFSMLLIILMHSIDHSGVLEASTKAGIGTFVLVRFLYMLTQISVNCYVMLSGYFLLRSRFRLKKIIEIWMEVAFYSFVIKLIFMLTREIPFSAVALLSCFFPILTGRYWFITIYIGLYLLSPFLNIAIRAMDKKTHGLLILTLGLLFSAWSSIHPSFAGMNSGGGWGLAWFVVLYITAAWFSLYYVPSGKTSLKMLLWLGISAAVSLLFCIPGGKIPLVQSVAGTWFHYNSLPVFLSTVLIFSAFLDLKIRKERLGRFITRIAPATLGVYLIHAHANLSPWIWKSLNLPSRMTGPGFFLFDVVLVALIFTACAGIDLIRKNSVGRLEQSQVLVTLCSKAEYAAVILCSKLFPDIGE